MPTEERNLFWWLWNVYYKYIHKLIIISYMLIIYANHIHISCVYMGCLEMPHAVRDVCLGGMIRGYDSGYDSWTWFVGMTRGPWFSVSPHPPCMVIYPHLPPKCFKCWWLYHTWSALELACCCHCACCCQSGVCALEPAWWCRWSAAARCWCRVLLAVRVVCTVWGGHAGGAQGAAAGAAWRWCLSFLNHALERACWWADAGRRCCLRVLSSYPAGAAARVVLEGAAGKVRNVPDSCCKGARCCCRVQLLEWRVRSGAGLLVPLQGAASRCCS